MISTLLKLLALKRLVTLGMFGVGAMTPQAFNLLMVAILGVVVGVGAVLFRLAFSGNSAPVVSGNTTSASDTSVSPVLVAIVGLLLGGVITMAVLAFTGG